MQAVVFDIGNVLIHFDPWNFLQRTFGRGAPLELYHAASFGSTQWVDLDRGLISQREAAAQLKERYPHLDAIIDQIFPGWFSSLTAIEPGVKALRAVKKQGVRAYALSNFHREAFDYIRRSYPWLELFDGWTISAHAGMLKPEAGIYQKLLWDHQLQPQRIIFLDDAAANLQSARYLGIAGLLVDDVEAISTQLEQSLGHPLVP